ncbi:MAG: YDG domain-containing protein, partial [Burkholderiales bacterium]
LAIAQRPLTFTATKVYDATTNLLGSLLTPTNLVTPCATDCVLGGTSTIALKDVGARAITVSGATLPTVNTAYWSNYTLTGASGTATVTAAPLTVTYGAANRVYNGTTNATVTASVTPLLNDSVSVAVPVANFSDKNAANGKTVTFSGMTLSGTDAGNYTVAASGTTTADITPLTLSITYAGVDRVYDGTNSATVMATPTNRVSGDNLTIAVGSASFNDTVATIGSRGKDVGSAKTVDYSNVSLSGSDAGNYSLAATSGATTAAITAKALTVTGITASNKVYDASQAATVSVSGANNAAVLQAGGLVAGDQLVVSATGLFDTKHVGVGKTVTLTSTYSGNYRNNYTLAGQATTT